MKKEFAFSKIRRGTMLVMEVEDVGRDYECFVSVVEYRISENVEYCVCVEIQFVSERTHTLAKTDWKVWYRFSKFRELDKHLRRRGKSRMKGIRFPRLYARRKWNDLLLNQNKALEEDFLQKRLQDLQFYMTLITHTVVPLDFHHRYASTLTRLLQSFIQFDTHFGKQGTYGLMMEPKDRIHSARMNEERIEKRKASLSDSNARYESYRWSGTGFHHYHHLDNSRPSSSTMDNNAAFRNQDTLPSIAPHENTCALRKQRIHMETELKKVGRIGVGMPPDGSCFLHCVVYELFPLKRMPNYPSEITPNVAIGIVDGQAPRRIQAANHLRQQLADYGIQHVEKIAPFLMQSRKELLERYQCFQNNTNEQATIAELYVAASMFRIELHLVSNDPDFSIEPVVPIPQLPPLSNWSTLKVTFGYLVSKDNIPGHYICTRPLSVQRKSYCNSLGVI